MKNKNYIAYAVLVIAVLVAGFLGVRYPMPDPIQVMGEGDTNFTNVVASGDLTAGDDITAGDALAVGGATTLTGDLTVAAITASGAVDAQDDLTIDDTLNIDDNAYTSVGTQTITPTVSLYLLSPATTLTLTLSTGSAVAGDFIWFVSMVTTSTVVVDTTETAGGGNRTLGQGDVIGFMYVGTVWHEAFYSDNS